MREARLTDRQKTDKDLSGPYASRVRSCEVAGHSKNELWAKGGGVAMKSKIGFGSAMLVLVATLFGVVGLAVPPASAVPKRTSFGCTVAQLQTPGAGTCIDKMQADIKAGKDIYHTHVVVCHPDGTMKCCVSADQAAGKGCESIKQVGPRGVTPPVGTLTPAPAR